MNKLPSKVKFQALMDSEAYAEAMCYAINQEETLKAAADEWMEMANKAQFALGEWFAGKPVTLTELPYMQGRENEQQKKDQVEGPLP